MKCPLCYHEDLKVIDSRVTEDNAIRRRRECQSCHTRFTTFEIVEPAIQVQKRDGRYEDFEQQKLIRGIQAASRHTSISQEQVFKLATKVMRELMQRQARQISSAELGEMVMRHLEELDPIAYIRFACVYRRIKNFDELMKTIELINTKDEVKSTL